MDSINLNKIIDEIKKEAINEKVPIIQDDSLELIGVILSIKKPKKILEIGTAVGYSSIQFSKYIDSDAKITTIELNELSYKKAIKNIQKVELSNVIEVINADATKYLEKIEGENLFDVIFIDAAKGQYPIFLEQSLRLIKTDGIIIADNVLFKGRVLSDYNEHKYRTAVTRLRKYIDIIKNDKRLNSTILSVGDGVAISVVNK